MSLPPPPLVLVHGAWHAAWCWQPLLPRLRTAGLQVLAPALPGHGDGEDPARVSLKHYTRALGDLLQGLDRPALLVGHSMAGMVISEVAAALPERVAALIYLAAFLPRAGDSVFSLMAANAAAQGSAPIEACMQYSADRRLCCLKEDAAALFYNHCDAATRAAAFARLLPQPSLALAARLKREPPGAETLPRYYLRCRDDRVLPVAHQDAMVARAPVSAVHELDSDHSPFLSQPENLARVLQQLALALP